MRTTDPAKKPPREPEKTTIEILVPEHYPCEVVRITKTDRCAALGSFTGVAGLFFLRNQIFKMFSEFRQIAIHMTRCDSALKQSLPQAVKLRWHIGRRAELH